MKKQIKNIRTVEFLQSYSTKSVGDHIKCDVVLAGSLVSKGVAKYVEDVAPNTEVEKENPIETEAPNTEVENSEMNQQKKKKKK